MAPVKKKEVPAGFLLRSGLARTERALVEFAIGQTIRAFAKQFGKPPEAVAVEAFYVLQSHPEWGRNASATHKRRSLAHWQGCCYECGQPVTTAEATYHHLKRGVPNQHGPENLVPTHPGCHDRTHNAVKGSLLKGTR